MSLLAVAAVAACALQPIHLPPEEPLLTVAERSGYTATSTSAQAREFIDELAERSSLVRVLSIGTTVEGKDIPLLILSDPPVATPEEAAKSGKLLILAFGNIHAGEVDGKEALLALARDLAVAREATKTGRDGETKKEQSGDAAEDGAPSLRLSVSSSLLDHVVLAIVPNYNADGNDRMGQDTRPGQVGPEQGQGTRENADGLDLNRDYVKLEAPETRALVRFMNEWDPAVVIDAHTTNGSYHRYLLTYGGPKNPAGDADLIEFVNGTMLPAIGARVKEKSGFETFFYGNFARDHAAWEDYPDQTRYGAPYVGLRNRIPILTESYSYATYQDRVRAQYAFIAECFAWAAEHRRDIRKVIEAADGRAVNAGTDPEPSDTIAVQSEPKAFEKKVTILGFEETREGGRARPTETPRDYEVEHIADFVPSLTVPRAFAYVLPAGATEAATNLQRHGITVEELRETVELDVEVYRVDSVTRAQREFQGHRTSRLEATPAKESRTVEAGAFVVRTGQKLGSLASYLLEPQAGDGLATWNLLGEVAEGQEFPVLRVPASAPLLLADAAPLPEDREPPKTITFETLSGPDAPRLSGAPIGGMDWLEDGESFRHSRGGTQWKIDATTGRATRAYDPSPAAKALAALPTISRRAAESLAGRGRWNEERTAFFVEHENDLYYATADGAHAVRLTSSPQEEEVPAFSPDGAFVAFVRENDLWVVDVATRTERALTSGGSDTIRNGKADWVYYEEIFGRNWRVFWWSPDSSRLAYMQVDSTHEPRYAIVNNSRLKQVVEEAPYPKPGEPNPRARLFTVSAAGGGPGEVDLSGYDAENMLLTRVFWRQDSSSLLATVTNRTQTWMDVLSAPAGGGEPSVLFRETTGAWVDESPTVEFLKDGSFLFASERTGWKHLYRYGKDGELVGPVTSGEWECRAIQRVDEEAGALYVTGTKDSHTADNLYRVSLDGSSVTRLTGEPGSHRVQVAPKGDLFIDSWSSTTQTPRAALRSLADGSLVRMLDTNPVRDLERFRLGEFSSHQISTPDGFLLEASLLKPPDFDPSRRYPVWFMTYAGPHAPTVSDSWSGQSRAWDQALAGEGFLVFRADPRSASGKGAVSAWAAYKQLGVPELADIEVAIQWLTDHPWADAERVGMAGHSYGGFMTAYALTHSELFAAGIAGAPVTDWREYDSIYTERYMLTPQENPDGYRRTSVVEGAKGLHGRLLLTHGMVDDNVHLQNNTRLVRALQQAGKPFEMMLYPDSRHGIGGRHYQQLQIDFIRRTLGGGPRPIDEVSPGAAPEPTTGP